jgi:hypothetical protein
MKKYTKFSFPALFLIAVFFLFQAFDAGDNNPNVDRPILTPQAYLNVFHNPPQLLVVTDPQGFDNFNMGVNFAETYVSQNPTNPFAMFHEFNIAGPGWWTTDGYTWHAVTVPYPTSAGDPWTAYDSLGNVFAINLNNVSPNPTLSYINKSTNNGQNWGTAVIGCTGNDRETMAADQTGGPYANYIYCGETPGTFARSTDHGASFTVTASMANNIPGFMMAPGPGPTGISGGSVYVVTSTTDSFQPTYTFYRSTDGGATFTLMSTQNGWVNTVGTQLATRNTVSNMRVRPYPFLYADNSFGTFRGREYVFYTANNPAGNGNKPDVFCRYSTDGGTTWSGAITINDDPGSTTNNNFHPAAWCDKMTGTLLCQWMDTRNCPTSDSAEIFASFSTNGGVTWAANQRISTAKMKIYCSSCGGAGYPATYEGDYNGMGSYNGIGILSWTDFRAGNFGSYGAYFPDYALRSNPAAINNLNGNGDSAFVFVTVPAVKLYTGKVKFSATVLPTPANGIITLTFLNKTGPSTQDSITAYPDSVRLRVKTTGGVTQQGYTVTIVAHGKIGNIEQTPVHARTVTMSVITGINNYGTGIPEKFYLYQNYPNPFNPTTEIRFDIARAGNVKIGIYDITGRKVADLVNGNYEAGKYIADFNAANYASGVYFYKIETANYTSIRKMILIK